jgi:hypothetical protein
MKKLEGKLVIAIEDKNEDRKLWLIYPDASKVQNTLCLENIIP